MRKILVFLCCFVLMGSMVLPAVAESPAIGTVNSTALSYFTGVVNNLPSNTDYVIYKSGDYSTALVYGSDFDYTDNSITSNSDCIKLVYNQRGFGSGASYTPTVNKANMFSFNLDFNDNCILYSNLGSFSSVGDTNKDNVSYILWTVVLLVLLFIVFKFFRNRRHYINL